MLNLKSVGRALKKNNAVGLVFFLCLTSEGDPNPAGPTAARLPSKQTHPPYFEIF